MRLHGAVTFRTAYVITSDAAEAGDAAQEAFVKTYRALSRQLRPLIPNPGEGFAVSVVREP